jgi:hypothetical protein
MNIMIRSADPTNFLTLRDIEVSRYGAEFQLAVSSRGFTGQIPYALEADELHRLLAAFRGMHINLAGSALLQLHMEETRVSFAMNAKGQVLVSGVFVHYKEPAHRLEFGFWSDQSCLPEFIAGLEDIISQMGV